MAASNKQFEWLQWQPWLEQVREELEKYRFHKELLLSLVNAYEEAEDAHQEGFGPKEYAHMLIGEYEINHVQQSMPKHQCTVWRHSGTDRMGKRCVLKDGHKGTHQFPSN